MVVREGPHLRSRPIAGIRCTLGLALIAGVALTFPEAAFSQPPIAVTTCQKITKPGLYEIDNVLIASSPATGDCFARRSG